MKPSFFAGVDPSPAPNPDPLPPFELCPFPIEIRPVDPNIKPVPYRPNDPSPPLASKAHFKLVAHIYADHREFVRRTVERHGVPLRDSDDITHEVFTIALTRIHDFDAAKTARPWLFVIAIQRAANYRRLARHRIESLSTNPPEDPPSDVPDVESALLDSEERTLIRELIGRMSPKLRAILIKHDLDERPMAEIANELGISVKTAHARLKLARDEVLRRGQALAAQLSAVHSAIPLQSKDLLRVRDVFREYAQDPLAVEKAALVAQRKSSATPLGYLVFG